MGKSLTTIPLNSIVTRFRMVNSDIFEEKKKDIYGRLNRALMKHHKEKKMPEFTGAPKLDIPEYPAPGATEEPIRYNLINEVGIGIQVLNGRVLGRCEGLDAWERFVAVFDYLLQAYRDSIEPAEPQDFLVQAQTVVRLGKGKNYDVFRRLLPDLNPPRGVFCSMGELAEKEGSALKSERIDMNATVKIDLADFIFKIQGPANEDNTLLWLDFVCRTPQEDYATESFFTLKGVETYLQHGLRVYEQLLAGHNPEVVKP